MRSAIFLASLLAAFVAVFAAAPARAAPMPLIVERMDASTESPAPARIVAGAYDGDFKPQPYAAIVPSRELRKESARVGVLCEVENALHHQALFAPRADQPRTKPRRR